MKHLGIALCSILLASTVVHAATVAYYQFNGSGTATVGSTVTDTTGNHHGTVAGGDLTYGWDPVVGSYLTFAADAGIGNPGNRVVIPGHSDFLFDVTGTCTIEAIFRTTQTGTGTNGVLISKGVATSTSDSQWWLRHQGNGQLRGVVEGFDNTTEDTVTSTGTPLVNDGEWYHVALVFDGAAATKRWEIYVDGILRGADASVLTAGLIGGNDTEPVVIGEYETLGANRSFAGDIAAIRLSNTALLPAEFLVIPEPSASALLAVGLGAMLLRRRPDRF